MSAITISCLSYKKRYKSILYFFSLEFFVWKDKEEKLVKSSFVSRNGPTTLSDGRIKKIYTCHQSGIYVPKGCGKRQIKSQGSCKSGKICLASIEVSIRSNSIRVKYHKNHCGHNLSLAHIHLSDSEKAVIARKLANGVTLQRILDDIRDSASNELTRIHLVTRKDLQNIKFAYNIQEMKKHHPEDKISVQLWVDKMKTLEQSPVLYFKQQGEVDAQQKLGKDFILIIMLPIQQELLKMLGHQLICVDSTHGTTAYDFYVSTILTVDEFGSGLPCAYCLSN
ncbi:uncharacterized protein LOC111632094 [Centruroides sculpturatus]|uniref:uncharacterized protein LOC111632094 n=1 Tax=Centruroides sculpturatus TaxID=218467 RepID=UPI000C6EE474|nr:uncharacterized protein LOC111632094 [Centruroides sculpturatus]